MFKWPLVWRKTHKKDIEGLRNFYEWRIERYMREYERLDKSWQLRVEENEKLKKEIKDLKEKKKPAKKKGKKNVV